MKIRFLFIVFLLVTASCTHGERAPQATEAVEEITGPLSLSILQGVTDKTTTQLSIVRPKSGNYRYVLKEGAAGPAVEGAEKDEKKRAGSDYAVDQVRYKGLKPNVRYRFEAYRGNELVDIRELQTLETDLEEVVFAVASCLDDRYPVEQKGMWTDLLAKKPNLLFLIGDNVYADTKLLPGGIADPSALWKRYVETRNALELYRARRLVPVFATWDDHDFGANDGDRTYPYKKESEEIFRTFFPQPPMPNTLESGPGVSTHLTAFGQHFFLMDDRTFRSPPNDPAETHWGAEQEKWLFDRMTDTKAPVWLMNGDQYFGKYSKFESYERAHPKSFKALLDQLKKYHASVVFVSGDRHLTEMMAIEKKLLGYATYEITTSAIHAKTFPDSWKKTPNPRKIAGESGVMNYAIFRASNSKSLYFEVTAYGPNNRVLYRQQKQVQHK